MCLLLCLAYGFFFFCFSCLKSDSFQVSRFHLFRIVNWDKLVAPSMNQTYSHRMTACTKPWRPFRDPWSIISGWKRAINYVFSFSKEAYSYGPLWIKDSLSNWNMFLQQSRLQFALWQPTDAASAVQVGRGLQLPSWPEAKDTISRKKTHNI